MKYKVHRFYLNMKTDKDRLETFLNSLVVSIVPHVKLVLKGMGATTEVDFLLIVEKTNSYSRPGW